MSKKNESEWKISKKKYFWDVNVTKNPIHNFRKKAASELKNKSILKLEGW